MQGLTSGVGLWEWGWCRRWWVLVLRVFASLASLLVNSSIMTWYSSLKECFTSPDSLVNGNECSNASSKIFILLALGRCANGDGFQNVLLRFEDTAKVSRRAIGALLS